MSDVEFKPGLYPNIEDHTYRAIPAVSNSYLKKLKHCPASALLPDDPPGSPLLMGQALHALLLEGEEVFKDVVVHVECSTRATKIYKDTAEAVLKERPHAILLTTAEYEQVQGMAKAVMMNPEAAKLLKERRETETGAVWVDEKTGLLCKAKIDAVYHSGMLADIKTTSSHEQFLRNTVTLGYFRQAAFYLRGYQQAALAAGRKVGDLPNSFCFIVVEQEEPYMTEVYVVDNDCLIYGTTEFEELLQKEVECREWGYPNYRSPGGVKTLELPPWLK
jgi:hypothetical protein